MIGHYKLINKDGFYIIKIHRKDAIAVPIPIKFSKKFHRGIYANKIQQKIPLWYLHAENLTFRYRKVSIDQKLLL